MTKVTESVIDRNPRWDRRNANPPLSANDAVVIADRFRKRLIEEGKLDPAPESSARWVLDSAHLVPFQAQQGKWFWLVHFWIDMDQTGSLNEIRLVVLMDGTVVEPEIQPES